MRKSTIDINYKLENAEGDPFNNDNAIHTRSV